MEGLICIFLEYSMLRGGVGEWKNGVNVVKG